MTKSSKLRRQRGLISLPDELVKTSREGQIELTEDELNRASGGAIFMKFGDKKGDVDTGSLPIKN